MKSHTLTDKRGNIARFDIFTKLGRGHIQIVHISPAGHNFDTENVDAETARQKWTTYIKRDGYKVA